MSPDEIVAQVLEKLEAFHFSLPIEKPEFSLRITFANSYEDLFRNRGLVLDESEIVAATVRRGRTILAAKGGGGKSVMLRRAAIKALQAGMLPFIIDLSQWKTADYVQWQDVQDHHKKNGTPFLIERFSIAHVSSIEFDWLPPTVHKLLIVDGLNEISATVGQQILTSLDDFVKTRLQASVLVADRLTRRDLDDPSRWNLCGIQAMSAEQIIEYGGQPYLSEPSAALLDSPFFLNFALKKKGLTGQRAASTLQFLEGHAELSQEELHLLAQAAFEAYRQNRARTFSYSWLVSKTTVELGEKLIKGGSLSVDKDVAQFSHHLLHDVMVALHVAQLKGDQLTPDVLDVITFQRSSFDVISLILEALPREAVDDFLRRVYDWSLYAAGYALSELEQSSASPSMEIKTVILAMLAEKRFDAVLSTRQRAKDGLLLIGSDQAKRYVDARSFEDIKADICSQDSALGWFREWKANFCRDPAEAVNSSDIEELSVSDSIKGWTLANVLRRATLTAENETSLRALLRVNEPTVRWRAAHALGARPTTTNLECLIKSLDEDSNSDVRYGAARSIAEMARAGHPQLSAAMLDAITERVDRLIVDEKVLRELASALVVVREQAPPGWSSVPLKLARLFYLHSDETEKKGWWIKYAEDVESMYASQS